MRCYWTWERRHDVRDTRWPERPYEACHRGVSVVSAEDIERSAHRNVADIGHALRKAR